MSSRDAVAWHSIERRGFLLSDTASSRVVCVVENSRFTWRCARNLPSWMPCWAKGSSSHTQAPPATPTARASPSSPASLECGWYGANTPLSPPPETGCGNEPPDWLVRDACGHDRQTAWFALPVEGMFSHPPYPLNAILFKGLESLGLVLTIGIHVPFFTFVKNALKMGSRRDGLGTVENAC